MARPAAYSYSDAGYNTFFRRTLVSNPNAYSLSNSSGSGSSTSNRLNFDDLQLSGALGDKVRFGRVIINGTDGRIEVEDENGNQVIWIGAIDD